MTPVAAERPDRALAAVSTGARRRLLDLAASRGVHLGASLSVIDILVGVYDLTGFAPDRPSGHRGDRVILSKGHSVWALYSVLAEFGVAGLDDPRAGHPVEGTPGVTAATGALGHGLSIGAGLALGARLDGTAQRSVVVLGDGELDEGSVWEAAMFAAHHRLANLVAVVDRNGLQQEGHTESILSLEPLDAKWASFGWRVLEADGHDHAALRTALRTALDGQDGRPTVVVARTVKGRGVSLMEGDARYHYVQLTPEEHAAATRALVGTGQGAA
ncbi:transketolase [Streptomyces tailanensis]|uniref:transketolase n=1 Tax=Streptomyces tailanensis TaxID=2569858 RepID=UPI00122E4EBA|nr:transketolase [Streptomyces tailanensis]